MIGLEGEAQAIKNCQFAANQLSKPWHDCNDNGEWSTCTKSCGTGSQQRSRIVTQPKNGGAACPHTAETQACNEHACAEHCVVSSFGAWSTCTLSCGTGSSQSRSRSVTSAAAHGGYVCPYLEESRACNI